MTIPIVKFSSPTLEPYCSHYQKMFLKNTNEKVAVEPILKGFFNFQKRDFIFHLFYVSTCMSPLLIMVICYKKEIKIQETK